MSSKKKRLKELYDKQMAKLTPHGDLNSQMRGKHGKMLHARAGDAMDKIVGPEWRVHIDMPDISVVMPVADPELETRADTKLFYSKVQRALAAEGMNTEDTEYSMSDSQSPDEASRSKLASTLSKLMKGK